jgi:hypothetical protein
MFRLFRVYWQMADADVSLGYILGFLLNLTLYVMLQIPTEGVCVDIKYAVR